jgi:hypothetical protein
VHVAGRNGKLTHVTVVARVLPRDWDGSRLLRFLAGLAMLALAFTAPAAPMAPAEPTPVVAVSETAPVTLSESVPITHPVRVTVAPSLPEGLPVPVVATFTALLIGLARRTAGPRAPPAA